MFDIDGLIKWENSERLFRNLFKTMAGTEQEKEWHAEGNVLNHTRMVCEELLKTEYFQKSDKTMQLILYLSCLMHDIGKIVTTREEDGRLVSPGHARIGSEMARFILWQVFGLCGTKEKQWIRESVCNLIRFHTFPPHAVDDVDGRLKLMKAAANGELSKYFNIERLCVLAEADVLGRICERQDALADSIELCREFAKENGCFEKPFAFPSLHTQYAYLSGRNIPVDYELYDDTWGEVILMSGLPGTGKDTWIREHYEHLPMISLDEIRKELKISTTDNQGRVIVEARDRAKEFLRKKQSFVWNATNITQLTRQKSVSLFTNYGASVKIVYLETALEEELRRNSSRDDVVPENAIMEMLKKLTPPDRYEAHKVEWHCV